MGCYNCKYLKMSDRKDGKINGSVYYCTKLKKYVNGAYDDCDNYYKDYARKTYESDLIYENGRHYSNNNTSIETLIFLAIFLGILAIIVNVFHI